MSRLCLKSSNFTICENMNRHTHTHMIITDMAARKAALEKKNQPAGGTILSTNRTQSFAGHRAATMPGMGMINASGLSRNLSLQAMNTMNRQVMHHAMNGPVPGYPAPGLPRSLSTSTPTSHSQSNPNSSETYTNYQPMSMISAGVVARNGNLPYPARPNYHNQNQSASTFSPSTGPLGSRWPSVHSQANLLASASEMGDYNYTEISLGNSARTTHMNGLGRGSVSSRMPRRNLPLANNSLYNNVPDPTNAGNRYQTTGFFNDAFS